MGNGDWVQKAPTALPETPETEISRLLCLSAHHQPAWRLQTPISIFFFTEQYYYNIGSIWANAGVIFFPPLHFKIITTRPINQGVLLVQLP